MSCFDDHSYIDIKLPNGSPKSCKITPKCMTNQREMSMKKIYSDRAMLKNARRRPTCKIASKRVRFCRYRCCFAVRHGCKNRSKSSKIYHKITTKNTKPGVAMVKNARRRPTCEHASKRVHFCRSRCCFAHAMVQKSLKIVENNRWGPVMCRRSGPPRGGPIRSVY